MQSSNLPPIEQLLHVYGIDLGHGESAVAAVGLHGEAALARPFIVEINQQRSFVSAFAIHKKHGPIIGREAITDDDVIESHIGFKRRITDGSTNRNAMIRFVSCIHARLKESSLGFEDAKSLVVVGCPTDWTKRSLANHDLVAAYEALLKAAGLKHVRVLSESRAAILDSIESGHASDALSIRDLRLFLVIDIGSSTTDATAIDLTNLNARPIDLGFDLGGAQIDKLILNRALAKNSQRDALEVNLRRFPTLRNQCELFCRELKVQWFNRQHDDARVSSTKDVGPDEIPFRVKLDMQAMTEVLREPLSSLHAHDSVVSDALMPGELANLSWPEAFCEILKKCRQELPAPPAVVLVTGGASRMDFIEPEVRKAFPESKFMRGQEPELAIAKGLAIAGRIDLRAEALAHEVQQAIDQELSKMVGELAQPETPEATSSLWNRLGTKIAQSLTAEVTEAQAKIWAETEESLGDLKQRLARGATEWRNAGNYTKLLRSECEEFIKMVAREFNTRHLVPVARKHRLVGAELMLDSTAILESWFAPPQSDTAEGNSLAEDRRRTRELIDEVLRKDTIHKSLDGLWFENQSFFEVWIRDVIDDIAKTPGLLIMIPILAVLASINWTLASDQEKRQYLDRLIKRPEHKRKMGMEQRLRAQESSIAQRLAKAFAIEVSLRSAIMQMAETTIREALSRKVAEVRIFIK